MSNACPVYFHFSTYPQNPQLNIVSKHKRTVGNSMKQKKPKPNE